MKCPKCDQDVLWEATDDGYLMLSDRGAFVSVATVTLGGEITKKVTGVLSSAHDCPERVKSADELRDEWWIEARDLAFTYDCPESRCGAEKGSPCFHLTTGDPNKWPHKTRVAVAVTPEFFTKGANNGWI